MSTKFRVAHELPRPRAAVREEPVDWEGAKEAMLANAGTTDWVLIAPNVHASTADQLRLGRYAAFPLDEVKDYEFRARKPEGANYGPRRTDIWGRYNGPVPIRAEAKKAKRR